MMGGALPMLRTRLEFQAVQAAGRSRADRLVSVRIAPNDAGHDRFGISTSRSVGGAVVRNRVRRRIREVLRRMESGSGPGRDILIVARPATATATLDELRTALVRLIGAVRRPSVRPQLP
jgi:ribonuclease P protein component